MSELAFGFLAVMVVCVAYLLGYLRGWSVALDEHEPDSRIPPQGGSGTAPCEEASRQV